MSIQETPAEQAIRAKLEATQQEIDRYDDLVSAVAKGRLRDEYGLPDDHLGANRNLGDVAQIMRDGFKPAPMLLEGWLAAGELHWLSAEPEKGKTWLALWWAIQVINAGDSVIWCDEETGPDVTAQRLTMLGANPDAVEQRFAYLPYPSWFSEAGEGDADIWPKFLAKTQPGLVVMDTATDALAEAGLNENDGREVTLWVKAFCEPARRVGAAVVVLDHVVKSGVTRGYAVGSRAKKAKAKVMFELKVKKDFGPNEVGVVSVTRTKNGVGAPIQKRQSLRFGGELDEEDNETFINEPASEIVVAAAEGSESAKVLELKTKMAAKINEHGVGGIWLTKSQVKEYSGGNATLQVKALQGLIEDPELYGIKVQPKGQSFMFASGKE